MSEEIIEGNESKNEIKVESSTSGNKQTVVTVDVEALKREYEDKIEKVRKEEKDKLYPSLEKYKTELAEKEKAWLDANWTGYVE